MWHQADTPAQRTSHSQICRREHCGQLFDDITDSFSYQAETAESWLSAYGLRQEETVHATVHCTVMATAIERVATTMAKAATAAAMATTSVAMAIERATSAME